MSEAQRFLAAVEAGDWEACRTVLGEALGARSREERARVVRAVVERSVADIERVSPDFTWPRRALEGVATEPAPSHAGAGSNSVAKAVQYLLDAQRMDATSIDTYVDSVSEAVMASMLAAWVAGREDAWRRWFDALVDGAADPADNPLLGFRRLPEVQDAERAAWSRVVLA